MAMKRCKDGHGSCVIFPWSRFSVRFRLLSPPLTSDTKPRTTLQNPFYQRIQNTQIRTEPVISENTEYEFTALQTLQCVPYGHFMVAQVLGNSIVECVLSDNHVAALGGRVLRCFSSLRRFPLCVWVCMCV